MNRYEVRFFNEAVGTFMSRVVEASSFDDAALVARAELVTLGFIGDGSRLILAEMVRLIGR